ncbi:hypothetical protein BZL29_5809 [Mycobacterium kansasii]|uniref:Uncharacterized protein n=1 Tax=Mycobacterium kansasii TaxID=1768 RepID=A0A1V3WWS3_MYCKA|nr:hypothetical protein BZL29_5809 [Mycobacterium kansasii]
MIDDIARSSRVLPVPDRLLMATLPVTMLLVQYRSATAR